MMKKYFFLLVITYLLSLNLSAQDEFKGGTGDGYASDKISFFITSLEEDKKIEQKVSVYPNPIQKGKQLSIAVPPNFSQITGIRIVDNLGRFVYEQSTYNLQESNNKIIFELEDVLEEGAYIMLLDFAKQTVIKKVVIFD